MVTKLVSILIPLLFLAFPLFGRGRSSVSSVQPYKGLTQSFVNRTKESIKTLFRSSIVNGHMPLMAAAVRLSFHGCVGGCDGCINMEVNDNVGLPNIIDKLDTVYTNQKQGINKRMSRADFWALAGIAGIETGLENKYKLCLDAHKANGSASSSPCRKFNPPIDFQWGRLDCHGGPYTRKRQIFPNPHHGLEPTLNFFKDHFRLSTRQTVAILGVHTIGGAHSDKSGFHGQWDETINSFDNGFYKSLTNPSLSWRPITNRKRTRFQWRGQDRHGIERSFMLNSDMCLYMDIKPDTRGATSCISVKECGLSQVTHDMVEEYAGKETKWLTDFGSAYTKLISNIDRNDVVLQDLLTS